MHVYQAMPTDSLHAKQANCGRNITNPEQPATTYKVSDSTKLVNSSKILTTNISAWENQILLMSLPGSIFSTRRKIQASFNNT